MQEHDCKYDNLVFSFFRDGTFCVDQNGQIWRNGKRAEHNSGSYFQIRKMINKRRYHVQASRMVWAWFFGPIPDGLVVNHKNGLKKDNHPDNLELTTNSGNCIHAYRTGLKTQYGEKNPAYKLSNNQVIQIRFLYSEGSLTQTELARMFGCSFQHMSRLVRGDARLTQTGPISPSDGRSLLIHPKDPTSGQWIAGRCGREWNELPDAEVARHEMEALM